MSSRNALPQEWVTLEPISVEERCVMTERTAPQETRINTTSRDILDAKLLLSGRKSAVQ